MRKSHRTRGSPRPCWGRFTSQSSSCWTTASYLISHLCSVQLHRANTFLICPFQTVTVPSASTCVPCFILHQYQVSWTFLITSVKLSALTTNELSLFFRSNSATSHYLPYIIRVQHLPCHTALFQYLVFDINKEL